MAISKEKGMVIIYLHKSKIEELRKEAEKRGLTLSSYCRMLLLDSYERQKPKVEA